MKDRKDLLITIISIFVIALFGTAIIGCNSTKRMASEASYWMNRSLAADAVIDSLINHYDDAYIYDVFMETDTWDEYSYLKYEEYERRRIQTTGDWNFK